MASIALCPLLTVLAAQRARQETQCGRPMELLNGLGIKPREDENTRYNLMIVGIAFATTAVATTTTFAYHHRHHSAPYGYGTPFHASRYGTYPSYTYDPDPRLRR